MQEVTASFRASTDSPVRHAEELIIWEPERLILIGNLRDCLKDDTREVYARIITVMNKENQ